MRQGLHIQWLADRAECITAMINLQKSLWHVSVAQCLLLLTINVYTSKLSCTKFVSAVYDFSTINYEELSAEEKHFSWSRPFIEEVWPKSISFLSLFYIYVLYYIFYLYLYFYSSFYWFALIVIWRMWQSALTHADSWAPLCGGILQKTMTPQYPRLRKCILSRCVQVLFYVVFNCCVVLCCVVDPSQDKLTSVSMAPISCGSFQRTIDGVIVSLLEI